MSALQEALAKLAATHRRFKDACVAAEQASNTHSPDMWRRIHIQDLSDLARERAIEAVLKVAGE